MTEDDPHAQSPHRSLRSIHSTANLQRSSRRVILDFIETIDDRRNDQPSSNQ
jgi:hypothetical protein